MNAKEIEQKILQLFKEIDNLKIVLKTTNEKIDFLTKPKPKSKLKKSGRPKKYLNPADAYEARLKQTRDCQKRQREAYENQKILKEIEEQKEIGKAFEDVNIIKKQKKEHKIEKPEFTWTNLINADDIEF
jgi:hypothetical protein